MFGGKKALGKCFPQQFFVPYQQYSIIFAYGNKRAVRRKWGRETGRIK